VPLNPFKFSYDNFLVGTGLIQLPTRIIHDAELEEKQVINEAKKQIKEMWHSRSVQRSQF
jgi:hypothetical protein